MQLIAFINLIIINMCCNDNSIDWVGIIQATSGLLSTIIAVVALIIAWKTEKRANKRFLDDQDLSKKIAKGNVKPIISTWTIEYLNRKGVNLVNSGTGTAIITEINFKKGETQEKNIAKLFNLEKDIIWDTYWTFTEAKCNLQAGQVIKLVELTLENLIKQGLTKEKAEQILSKWQTELEGIIVEIQYQDVLDNAQDMYTRTFHS